MNFAEAHEHTFISDEKYNMKEFCMNISKRAHIIPDVFSDVQTRITQGNCAFIRSPQLLPWL